MESPAPQLRKAASFAETLKSTNFRTKITSTYSQMNSTSQRFDNKVCHVCTTTFSSKSQSSPCGRCRRQVCKNHNLNTWEDVEGFICDSCYKDMIREEQRGSKEQEIREIQKQITKLSKRNEKFQADIESKRKEKKKIKVNTDNIEKDYSVKITGVQQKISEEQVTTESLQKCMQDLQNVLKETKNSLVRSKERLESTQVQNMALKQEYEQCRSQERDLDRQIQTTFDKSQEMIQIERIRTLACHQCFRNLRKLYSQEVHRVFRPSTLSALNSYVAPSQPKNEKVCNSCLIF